MEGEESGVRWERGGWCEGDMRGRLCEECYI